MAGAAIGASGDFMDRAEALIRAGADCLLMDVAHADSDVIKKPSKISSQNSKAFQLFAAMWLQEGEQSF